MNLFKPVKEAKNILDLITYDLTTFFHEDYKEINSEEILDTVLIDYEKELPWKEFNIFNRVVFRVFIEKTNLTGTNHINVTFHTDHEVHEEHIEEIIKRITKVYGTDDNRKGYWSDRDIENFKRGQLDRMWTLGKNENIYSLRLIYNKDEGLIFTIMFFTNLLKQLDRL